MFRILDLELSTLIIIFIFPRHCPFLSTEFIRTKKNVFNFPYLLLVAAENEISMPEIRRFGHPLIRRQYVLPNTPIPKVFVDRNVHLTPGYVTYVLLEMLLLLFINFLRTKDGWIYLLEWV